MWYCAAAAAAAAATGRIESSGRRSRTVNLHINGQHRWPQAMRLYPTELSRL